VGLTRVARSAVLSLLISPEQRAAYAQGEPVFQGIFGTPTQYAVTVNSCDMSTDGGTTYVNLFSTPVSMDIATGTAGGAAILDLITGTLIPAGTYDTIKCAVSATIQFTGSVTSGATTYYTTSAFPTGPSSTTGPAESVSITGSITTVTIPLPAALVVAAGSTRDVRVEFRLENSIELAQTNAAPVGSLSTRCLRCCRSSRARAPRGRWSVVGPTARRWHPRSWYTAPCSWLSLCWRRACGAASRATGTCATTCTQCAPDQLC
jgi:hypothetical protein